MKPKWLSGNGFPVAIFKDFQEMIKLKHPLGQENYNQRNSVVPMNFIKKALLNWFLVNHETIILFGQS